MPNVSCEVCGTGVTDRRLRDGSTLASCPQCSHVLRDLGQGPANHRSLAYGGDPGLDRVRLTLTFSSLRRLAELRPGQRVFEIGFGAGALLRRLLDSGVHVAGCDPDQLQVAVDEQVLAAGDIHATSIEALGASVEPVDLVYGIHVIEHVEDIAVVARASHDLLVPGGQVAFMTPAADSWSLSAFSDAWWLLEDPTHIRFFSAASARRFLEDAGFVDVRVRRLLTDNLTMEGASLLRLARPAPRPGGVLETRRARIFATAVAPFALVVRALVPRWRPTMFITARRGPA